MIVRNRNNRRLVWILPIVGILVFVFLSSCSKKMKFAISRTVPAAEGYVEIKKDDNNNRIIDVQVKNLAEVSRLKPSKQAYVVWMETEDNGVKNIGQLKSLSKFLSSSLNADLKTVTPFEPVDFFITAEDDVSIQVPGSYLVLATK